MEQSGAVGDFSGALDNSSIFLGTDEAMSASSWVPQDADDATSEASWTAMVEVKERDWWSVNLEGEMEKLEVAGPWSGQREDGPTGQLGQKSQEKKANSRKRLKWKWMVMCLKKRVLKSKVQKEK